MIIWIIGSMASGKTTLNKGLISCISHCRIGDGELIQGVEKGVDFMYTKFDDVASIGVMKDGVATCGIDPVMGKLKTTGVELSIKKAHEKCDFVIVEGAQAAVTWLPFISNVDPNFLFVHLDLRYDDNIQRLKLRQYKKLHGTDPKDNEHLLMSITDKNYDSVIGKNKQYLNLWNKISGDIKNKIQVNALMSPANIMYSVIKEINKITSND